MVTTVLISNKENFNILSTLTEEIDVLNKPRCIFNINESNLELNGRLGVVVAEKV